MAEVFRALADPSRRRLLDQLFERDGQTLGELASQLPSMTRFGVMRHLRILEAAGLVSTRRMGREKHHYLDPVPIRLIHDRWISKYAEPVVAAMSGLKEHVERTMEERIDHVYSVYIRATPERVWRALTDGTDTERYYYGTHVRSTWQVGAPVSYTYPDGTVAADGEVLEVEAPRRLVMTFHARWDPELAAEGPVRQIWELVEHQGATKLTVTSSGLRAGSRMAEDFGGGMVWIVSGLKSLLETGQPLAAGAAG
jgi:uncharacterized protein YndB with AHSA1/START domain